MARHLLRDWWLPAALAALAVHEVQTSYADLPVGRPALLTGVLPLVLITGRRRREPVLVAVLVALLAVIHVFGVQGDAGLQPPLAAFLALLTAMFSLGLHGSGRGFVPGAMATGALLGGLQVGSLLADASLDDVIPSSVFLAGAFGIGRLIRSSRSEAASERERASSLEEERERHVAVATEAERNRIARELHDVVAHSLSLMVVQASVEARLIPDHDSAAAGTLRSIEHQGRSALVELRRLLGLLREEEGGAALRPLPTLDRLEDAVAELRKAGHRVTVDRIGDVCPLPPGVDLAAYRVVQEALTNAARHAPASDVAVTLSYEPGAIGVQVVNDGPAAAPISVPGQGFGLDGMRERVRLYGGSVVAAPRPGGGFRVDARIPVVTG